MRPRRPPISAFVLAAVAALAGLRPAAATSYVKMSDEALFDRSAAIVEGRVFAIEAAPGRERPAVDYLVGVERVVKGFVPGSNLVVRVPGGVNGNGVGLRIRGAPRFASGEELLLFLVPRRDGTFALHQLMLGAFHVEAHGGAKIAWRFAEEAREIEVPGQAAPADGVRDLAAFREWMIDRGQGARRRADYFLPDVEPPAAKFALVDSSDEPAPLGCGDTGGHNVRWFDDRTPWPVTWRYHVAGQDGLGGGGLLDFQMAVRAWGDDPNTPIRYLYLGRTQSTHGFEAQDGLNAVIFEDPNDEIGGSFLDGGVLAIGGPWFLCELDSYSGEPFHPIIEADIVLQDGVQVFFEAVGDAARAAQELFAHELGHTLGLAHSPYFDALMRTEAHADGRGASLDVDDLAAAFYLYGRPRFPTDNDGPFQAIRAPEAPSELAATVGNFTEVALRWSDNSGNESNFRIERRRRGELNFRFAATVPAGVTGYVDTVEPESVYTYRVMAQNAGGRSLPSGMVRVEAPHDPRPRSPSNLLSAATSNSRVRLTWQDNSDDEAAFAVELQRQNAFIEIPFEIPADQTSVELLGLTPGLPFSFRVRARNAFGDSAPSNVATSTTYAVDVGCESRDNRLCLTDGRYAVDLVYEDPATGLERPAQVEPITDEVGAFWFFGPANPELVVRRVDLAGESVVRIVFSGLTAVGYRVRATDTATGAFQEARHPSGVGCRPDSESSFVFPSISAARPPQGVGPDVENSVVAALDLRTLDAVFDSRSDAAKAADVGDGCPRSDGTLCVFDGRFAVEVSAIDPSGGAPPLPARALGRLDRFGLFSFGPGSRPDLLVKLLDARAVNGRFWLVSSASFTPVAWELSVIDLLTGRHRSFSRPAGAVCGVADVTSFTDEP